MTSTVTGERSIELWLDSLPLEVHNALEVRLGELGENLRARVEAAAPRKTGRLKTEFTMRLYSEERRIAAYVSVYAPGLDAEYPKAATLEYGTDRPRHAVERIVDSMGKSHRRILDRISKPVHIEARRYLRGPFAEMLPDVQADLAAVVSEVAAE